MKVEGIDMTSIYMVEDTMAEVEGIEREHWAWCWQSIRLTMERRGIDKLIGSGSLRSGGSRGVEEVTPNL
jgi:hypothetical protein